MPTVRHMGCRQRNYEFLPRLLENSPSADESDAGNNIGLQVPAILKGSLCRRCRQLTSLAADQVVAFNSCKEQSLTPL